jgi:hypothetical protein
MIRHLGLLALAVASAIVPAANFSQASPRPARSEDERDPKADAFTSALVGEWRGTLEYRDYSNDKRVTLPTTLDARAAEDGRAATLKFRYDEGKGRFVEGANTLRVDSEKGTLVWESDGGKVKAEYTFTGLDAFAGNRQGELVLVGLGIENDVKVEVRQTITFKGDELTILKETRKPGASFAFRNAYKLRRDKTTKAAGTPSP